MADDVTQVGGGVSGFVTDDGKDLDERYLGINAKAKSAESADSLGNWVNAEYPSYIGDAVNVSGKSWVAPKSGVFSLSSYYGPSKITIDGATLAESTSGSDSANHLVRITTLIKEGATVASSRGSFSGALYPHAYGGAV
jgi:hypothetical protein